MIKIIYILLLTNASLILAQEYDWQNNHIRIGERVMLTEQFRPVKDYEGLYEISNYGRVKSLPRNGTIKGERFLVPALRKPKYGYLFVALSKNDKSKNRSIHTLVWDAFGDQPRTDKLRIDHIDNNKLNNQIDNLQLLTTRQNISKYYKTIKELPTGVSKNQKYFCAHIVINKKLKHLGYFSNPEDASLAYQESLRIIGEPTLETVP